MEEQKRTSWHTSTVGPLPGNASPVVITSYRGEIGGLLSEYRNQGQKEAAEHRPPSDALTMDQHETRLQSIAEKWLADEQHLFDTVVTEINRAATEVRQKVIELSTRVELLLSDDSLRSTMDAEMAGERESLVSAAEHRMRRQVELNAFRFANGISDQATYPDSLYWHYGWIAVLALIETVINAFFYENQQGLLGGFVIALAVASVNMIGALVLGMGFRFKNLASTDKRMFGWFCLVLFIVLSLYCNALFAAFRGQYQLLADPSEPQQVSQAFAQAAVEAKRIFVLDMQVSDLLSFILLGIGLLLSGFAFYKGYTADDRYPGHGAKDRAARKAQQLEQEKQSQLRQKIKDFLQRQRADVVSVIHEPTQLIQRASTRAGDLQHAEAALSMQTQAVQRDFELVLRAYRDANMAVRATNPPAHFAQVPNLLTRIYTTAARMTADGLAKIQEDVKSLRERYQKPLNDKQNQLTAESAAILREHLDGFIKEVEDEARDRIDRASLTLARAA